jgi:repressor LexA
LKVGAYMNTIGERIKHWRKERGFTQKELAEKTNMSRSHIASIEKDLYPPSISTLTEIANVLSVDKSYFLIENDLPDRHTIPVLGQVQAGIPIDAIQDILDYEEITPEMAAHGEYFALQVKGNSMEPRMREGDVVIVKRQPDVNHDDTAIVLVNGDEATIKRVLKTEAGILLAPNNPAYETKFYSNREIVELPLIILGKVVELRAKF